MNLSAENGKHAQPGNACKTTVARILLADSDLASRLTLRSLLSAAGYAVDSAASASEAIGKLDVSEYQLVLADLRTESDDAGDTLLSYARQKDFHPATALIASDLSEMHIPENSGEDADRLVQMSNANISYLLARVAELIGNRAYRRVRKSQQRAS